MVLFPLMINVHEATDLIQKHLKFSRYGEETSEDILADRDYPPFHRVMMDGIAVSWNVFREGRRTFPVAGIMAAGVPRGKLTDLSFCLEVMTGAPLPEGTELVIPYEHLEIKDGIAKVVVSSERCEMENVHLKGSDAIKGDILLKKGMPFNGPHIGIAASVGQKLSPHSIKINIISTGDELVEVHETPLEHQIRRSNAHALRESLRLHGFQQVELSHIMDEESAIEDHYKNASKNFELLIYSGGVSKGKFDYLPSVWKKLGVQEIFHGISQRPGKPLWFGTDEKTNTIVFGLPGNPVSSLVCLHRYLLSSKEIYAQLDTDITFKKDLTFFVPVKITSDRTGVLKATPLPIQNSGEFSGLASSDGFLELPKDQSVFNKGEAFRFHPWRPM